MLQLFLIEISLTLHRKDAWFQFNDETVTKIKDLGDNRKANDASVIDIENTDDTKCACFDVDMSYPDE